MTVFGKTNHLARKYTNCHLNTKTLMDKKHVLLEDEASDWLQLWMMVSSLNVKGNKAIKKQQQHTLIGWFSHIRSQLVNRPLSKLMLLVVFRGN